jgi:histidinol-phosphate aminotransferase
MTDWQTLVRESLRDLGPYVPGSSAAEVEVRYGMTGLARLNWNEGLFGTLPGVLEQAAAGLEDVWMYPDVAYERLRDELASWLGVSREQVLPAHGIQALVTTVAAAFLSAGDRVVIPCPTYGLYAPACLAAGAVVERVESPHLAFDLEAIAAAARRTSARLVWICDPNNPTGARLDPAEWAVFLDALPSGCVAVADEAYVDFVAPAARTPRLDDIAAGRPVIVLRTFSKIFGLAGLRLGYAVVDPVLTTYLQSVQEPFNVNVAALVAGIASLASPARIDERRVLTNTCRGLLVDRLREAGLDPLPSSANFVLVPLGVDDVAVTDAVARRGLLVRAGTEFGLPGYARVTVAPPPLMERVSEELGRAVRAAGGRAEAA